MTTVDDQLRALAGWASRLSEPDFSFGEWTEAKRLPDGVTHVGYYTLSPEAYRFVTEMASVGLVYPFDWPSWASGEEGRRLLSGPDAVAAATAAQLGKLLTTVVRGDRFSEGALASAYERGLLTAAARRARDLLRGPAGAGSTERRNPG
jgi:hypothetical protein